MNKRECDKRRAVVLLYERGVAIDVIAEALCLKKSTVRQYIYLYLRDRRGATSVAVQQQQLPEQQRQPEQRQPVVPPVAENQWIALLRSRGQQ